MENIESEAALGLGEGDAFLKGDTLTKFSLNDNEDNSNKTKSTEQPDGSGVEELTAESTSKEEDEWLEVLGNDQLRKRVLTKGTADTRPRRGNVCKIKLEGYLDDGKKVENFEELTIQLGDAEVVQGLDLAIPLMETDEIAEVKVASRFAYGKLGLPPDIPANSNLTYKIHLLEVNDEPETELLSIPERKSMGNEKRERGNFWFSREEYSLAIQCYRRAIDFLDEADGGIQVEPDDDERAIKPSEEGLMELIEDRLKVFNNLAAAQLKIGALDSALQSVKTVLMCQPDNVKALFRKAKILSARGEYAEALSALKRAAQLEPTNKPLYNELNVLILKQKKENAREKSLYKKMLGQSDGDKTSSSNKNSSFINVPWGVVVGGLAAVVAGVLAYRYKFMM